MDDIETKLNDKTEECTRLGKEVTMSKKELGDVKENIDKGLELKG